MRTTLNVDDDVLELARSVAEARKISVGSALSYLARRGVSVRVASNIRNGFHVFSLDQPTPSFGPEDVKKILEAEDLARAAEFGNAER